MNTEMLEKFTETEKKVIELMNKSYNEEKIANELSLSLEEVRTAIEKYTTIAFNLEDSTKHYEKEEKSYEPNPLDYVEANGIQEYGGMYIKDGVYVDEGEGLPLHTKDFRSIFEKQLVGLTPDEEEIYKLKTGMFDGNVKTIKEIAEETGKTEAEVEKILERASEKIKEIE